MQPRVQISYGTAFDVLLEAAAVADPNWRATFDTGVATYDRVLSATSDDFVRQVAAFGRFGWFNLTGLLTEGPSPWEVGRLLAAVRALGAEELHVLLIGGGRRQLVAAVGEGVVLGAVRGDLEARDELAAALASDDLVLEAAPWLLSSASSDIQLALVDVLQTWQDILLPAPEEAARSATLHDHAQTSESVLARSTGREYLAAAVGGLHYEPAGLDRVISVATPQVAPVVVVVDGLVHTVLVHPPLGAAARAPEQRQRLLELGRAVGDRTRLDLLLLMQDGDRTAVELAGMMQSPRTSLLHHLAILRSAGLITVTVTPGGATRYRLRPAGFAELSAEAAGFLPPERPG